MNKKRARLRNTAMRAAIIGLSGAASAAVLDIVLHKVPIVKENPLILGTLRLAGGVGAAIVASKAGARDDIVIGIAAGPVVLTALEVGARLTRSSTVITIRSAGEALGAPWMGPRLASG